MQGAGEGEQVGVAGIHCKYHGPARADRHASAAATDRRFGRTRHVLFRFWI